MRKVAIVLFSVSLAGCASQREYLADHIRPQHHVIAAPVAKPKPKPMPSPSPVVVAPDPNPAPVAVPLAKPRWYDEFKGGASKLRSKL